MAIFEKLLRRTGSHKSEHRDSLTNSFDIRQSFLIIDRKIEKKKTPVGSQWCPEASKQQMLSVFYKQYGNIDWREIWLLIVERQNWHPAKIFIIGDFWLIGT